MQEKTLEELKIVEFREKFQQWENKENPRNVLIEMDSGILEDFLVTAMQEAREEGREEAEKECYSSPLKAIEVIRTQYKEELLEKLPNEVTYNEESTFPNSNMEYFDPSMVDGWNDCLSEVKKLLV